MQYVKGILIFAVGAAVGTVGGGFLGYELGSTNPAIDRAQRAAIVPVQPAPTGTPQPPHSDTSAPAEPEVAPPPAAPETVVPPVDPEAAPAPAEPEVAPPPAAPVSSTHNFVISPNDASSIMWVGYKTVLGQRISMEGGFANFEGKITVQDADPAKSLVEVVVDIDSIFSVNAILTTVLRGTDFFSVTEHPEARFVSTKVETTADGYLITGNFTMRDVTQGVQFPATIERREDGLFATAEFIIDRKLWNVGYDVFEDSVILNEVVVQLEILATPA